MLFCFVLGCGILLGEGYTHRENARDHNPSLGIALIKHPVGNFRDIVARLAFHKQHVFTFKLAD